MSKTDTQLVARADPNVLAYSPSEPSIASILDKAVSSGMDPATLEKLLGVYERLGDRQAAQQFAAAMSAFKAECPPIPRRTDNPQFKVSVNGTPTLRKYAALEDIEKTIREPLGKHGLSYRWGETKVANGVLTMACIVAHAGGHKESSEVSLPVDSKAGCSEQQKYGAAMSYAMRYSLVQALGLTTCDEDADGNDEPAATISESQAADLAVALENVKGNLAGFCRHFGIESLSDLPAASLPQALNMIDSKRKAFFK